jgi:putative peptidoglycan lipid II flippase
MVWLLWSGSRSMGDAAKFDARVKKRLWLIVLASILMCAMLLCAVLLVGPALGMTTIRYFALAFVVFVGISSYFGIGHLIGAFRLSEFKIAMRRN